MAHSEFPCGRGVIILGAEKKKNKKMKKTKINAEFPRTKFKSQKLS